jgi:hypothetical protein
MKAVQIIESKGRSILLMDLSYVVNTDDLSKRVDEIIVEVKKSKKPKSVFAMMDLSNLKMNKKTLPYMKKLSQNNGPYL